MLTEDYIRRQIALATAFLAQILGLKSAGQYDQALQSIDQALEQLTGLQAGLLMQLDERGFLDLLTRQNVADLDRLLLLAEIYAQGGDLHAARSQDQAAALHFQRSLLLYLEIAQVREELPPPEMQTAIAELRRRLDGIELPFEMRLNLLNYDELLQTGKDET